MLYWRKVDVCGLQEVRFKNEGVQFLQCEQKMRYKMFWKGGKKGQNGVGIVVQEEWVGSVVRVMRASERLMAIELALGVSWLHLYQCMLPRSAGHRKRRMSVMMSYTELLVS